MSYRSKHPFKVVGEITGCQAHVPEKLKAMKDGVERTRQMGIEAIED
jgi:hypothetical protein